ncbi:hypothetical protein LR48_Vigan08g080800 [Vigna angularis]|nr:hypothetical protein LR48_Vigan08g080800 [Vigna angularis]
MEENPSKDIMDVLRISYDGLENIEKEIFLDIACFFSNNNSYSWEPTVKKFLDYRQFYPDIGMKVLIEKSLISRQNGNIKMHDLLKELGKSIVREKAPKEPRKWSRLWNYKDLQKVMKINKEAKNVEAIFIEQHEKEFLQGRIRVDTLSKMDQLELLILKNVNCYGTLNFISNELRYLFWNHFPWLSLPSTFFPDQLVELILPHSNIKQLWEGKKCLPNLRNLDLSHSKNPIEAPDLSEVPRLTYLDLKGCIQLVHIHPSIGILRDLRRLNLKSCKNLIEVSDLSEVPRLTDLNLKGCIQLVHIHPSIGILRDLRLLNLKNCKNLVLNLNILFGISSLKTLNISGCSQLLNSKMLMDPSDTKHLEKVDKNTNIIQLPTSSVYKLLMLPFHFFYPPKPQVSLGLLSSFLSFSVPCLCDLDISFCNLLQIPDEIGNLRSLKLLNLGGNKFVTLPSTIKQLSNLRCLNLTQCKELKYLPELPKIQEITIGRCYSLYTFDCSKLSDMEHCYSIFFSWMTKNLEDYLVPRMEIVIPGIEIPKWFSKQNASTSISMDPSAVIDDPNWIGVSICALFVTHEGPVNLDERDYPTNDTLYYGVNNFINFGLKMYSRVSLKFKKDLVTVGLDYLLIVFYSRQDFIHLLNGHSDTMHDLQAVKFETWVESLPGLRFMVKKCGYRWVFKEDLQQFNSDKFFSRNSSSRKRKLLTSE